MSRESARSPSVFARDLPMVIKLALDDSYNEGTAWRREKCSAEDYAAGVRGTLTLLARRSGRTLEELGRLLGETTH